MSNITYGSAICGFKNYSYINNVHKRACKYFLGVGRYTRNVPEHGDMGWKPPFNCNGYLSVGNGVGWLI